MINKNSIIITLLAVFLFGFTPKENIILDLEERVEKREDKIFYKTILLQDNSKSFISLCKDKKIYVVLEDFCPTRDSD